MSSDDLPVPDEREETTMSYRAVSVGLPVVTHDGDQFGVVEHVLEVPELDVFDGVVVYTGTGMFAAPHHEGRLAEAFQQGKMLHAGSKLNLLRFVDADQVEAITPGYVKCLFDRSHVALLPAPQGQASYHVDMLSQGGLPMMTRYGRVFGRPHWTRDRRS